VRTEDVYEQSKAQSFADLFVPLSCEILVFTVENGNKAQKRSIKSVEVDQKNYNGNVDELHDGDFLKLSDCLIVGGVVFLKGCNLFKNSTHNYVDNDNYHGCANYQRVLNEIVCGPVSAVF